MTLGFAVAASSAASTICIAALALLDPKRRRSLRGRSDVRVVRWLLLLATFVPGVWLAFAGRPVPVVLWFGAICIVGWASAQLVNRFSHGSAEES